MKFVPKLYQSDEVADRRNAKEGTAAKPRETPKLDRLQGRMMILNQGYEATAGLFSHLIGEIRVIRANGISAIPYGAVLEMINRDNDLAELFDPSVIADHDLEGLPAETQRMLIGGTLMFLFEGLLDAACQLRDMATEAENLGQTIVLDANYGNLVAEARRMRAICGLTEQDIDFPPKSDARNTRGTLLKLFTDPVAKGS